MGLPKYGTKKRTMPVVNAANWSSSPAAGLDAFEDEDLTRHQATDAERARTVLANNRLGVVSVVVGSEPPSPFGFSVPYSITGSGTPIFSARTGFESAAQLCSGLSACLAVAETPLTAKQSGGTGGVCVLGTITALDDESLDEVMSDYVRTQPADASAVKIGTSKLFRLEPAEILVSSSRGELIRLTTSEYEAASSDPLSAVAPGLVTHLSANEGGSLVLLCRAYGGQPKASSAQLAGIDQYGMDVLVMTPHGRESVRLAFTHPVTTPEEVRRELMTMARGARFKLGVG